MQETIPTTYCLKTIDLPFGVHTSRFVFSQFLRPSAIDDTPRHQTGRDRNVEICAINWTVRYRKLEYSKVS
jgi:hypothetical protein